MPHTPTLKGHAIRWWQLIRLLPALVSFVQLVLEGATPSPILLFFFGANLTALHRKQGRIQPITVSGTWHPLTAKVAGSLVMKESLWSLETLNSYLNRTSGIRKVPDKGLLFTFFVKPHNPVSSATIAIWLKSVIT